MNKESPDGMLAFPFSMFTFILNSFSYSLEFSAVAVTRRIYGICFGFGLPSLNELYSIGRWGPPEAFHSRDSVHLSPVLIADTRSDNMISSEPDYQNLDGHACVSVRS